MRTDFSSYTFTYLVIKRVSHRLASGSVRARQTSFRFCGSSSAGHTGSIPRKRISCRVPPPTSGPSRLCAMARRIGRRVVGGFCRPFLHQDGQQQPNNLTHLLTHTQVALNPGYMRARAAALSRRASSTHRRAAGRVTASGPLARARAGDRVTERMKLLASVARPPPKHSRPAGTLLRWLALPRHHLGPLAARDQLSKMLPVQ